MWCYDVDTAEVLKDLCYREQRTNCREGNREPDFLILANSYEIRHVGKKV